MFEVHPLRPNIRDQLSRSRGSIVRAAVAMAELVHCPARLSLVCSAVQQSERLAGTSSQPAQDRKGVSLTLRSAATKLPSLST